MVPDGRIVFSVVLLSVPFVCVVHRLACVFKSVYSFFLNKTSSNFKMENQWFLDPVSGRTGSVGYEFSSFLRDNCLTCLFNLHNVMFKQQRQESWNCGCMFS